jgi:hypothetical protein
MRYFPRNMRTKKTSLPVRYKGCRPRIRLYGGEIGYDYRREFDLLVDEIYNGISAERRKVLWTLTGSSLITQNDKNQDPHIRLTNALIQAHENLPK